jgi:hypothetical protein
MGTPKHYLLKNTSLENGVFKVYFDVQDVNEQAK